MATRPPNVAKPQAQSHERTCCGVIEEVTERAREKRYNRTKPQPWIVRKLMIGVTLGIMGYAGYVYIARLCIPMIRRERGAQAGRSTGIALLVVFCVLYLWMLWAYLRLIVTSPGYARDHVPKSEQPFIPAIAPLHESWQTAEHETARSSADPEPAPRNSQQSRPSLGTSTSHTATQRKVSAGLAGPSYEDLLRRDDTRRSEARDRNVGVLDVPKHAFTDAAATSAPKSSSPVTTSSTAVGSPPHNRADFMNKNLLKKPHALKPTVSSASAKRQEKEQREQERLEALNITRRPSMTPVLHPVHRYCGIDHIVKPYRAHHCRVCGTCVLKYDHHCPWIGQCVGARNQKFFFNFNEAAVVFTAYAFGTTLAYTIKPSNSVNIDPQEIILIALAGFFCLFTTLLVISHVGMILRGMTTVESMLAHNTKRREEDRLARGFKWWQIAAKTRQKKLWDKEWGTIDREGNIWWQGNAHTEWISVMGTSWLGWILPIGHSADDGLTYPVNPRFDAEGRWRRRSEWPAELQ
ncbi:zf-DHHC-domain-containing protein [Pholiota conissans]|uniref:Palmitoyltransferase n=1 Tax=Pholiota conissans TaxID=109636 RepID=A0A9P5Z5Y6_9AGAR|nr:zf-DHHC-domain-containing protein [Pholiota conissans]